MQISVTGVKRFTAKTKKLAVYARSKFAPEVAQNGYEYAVRHAPHRTGALIAATKVKKGKKSGKVILIQPGGTTRPYHLWMHGIRAPGPGGKGYDLSKGWTNPISGRRHRITSGDPMFMFATYEEMIKDTTERFKKKVEAL